MMVDLVNVAVTTGIGAMIQGLVGLLIWFTIRRNIEKVDRLENKLSTLEERRVNGIEKRFEGHCEHDANARKKIYEDLTFIRTRFVHVESCAKIHAQASAQLDRFQSAVTDLARVQEATEINAKTLERLGERLISVSNDVARVEASQERKQR